MTNPSEHPVPNGEKGRTHVPARCDAPPVDEVCVTVDKVVAVISQAFPEWKWQHTDGQGCTLIWGVLRLEEGGARYSDVELSNVDLARFKNQDAVRSFAEEWMASGLDGHEAASLVR